MHSVNNYLVLGPSVACVVVAYLEFVKTLKVSEVDDLIMLLRRE